MDSNKDEALRCIGIAKQAIALGNKQKALKFIEIAQRLNHNLSVDDLLAACENQVSPGSASPSSDKNVINVENGRDKAKLNDAPNGERNYTSDHLQLIRQIMSYKDYYAILGVSKSCSVEEIKKSYRKLSLKIHPDKNKAPGSEEAFKKVSKAFMCLSDEGSRRQYDQTGLVDEFEYNQQCNVRRRRRRTANDLFDDDFDPDEIFRAFFGQTDMFRTSRIYRTRAAKGHQREDIGSSSGHSFMLVLQLLTFFLIVLLAYFPFSEPEYSLQKAYPYQFRKIAGDHGESTLLNQLNLIRITLLVVLHETT